MDKTDDQNPAHDGTGMTGDPSKSRRGNRENPCKEKTHRINMEGRWTKRRDGHKRMTKEERCPKRGNDQRGEMTREEMTIKNDREREERHKRMHKGG